MRITTSRAAWRPSLLFLDDRCRAGCRWFAEGGVAAEAFGLKLGVDKRLRRCFVFPEYQCVDQGIRLDDTTALALHNLPNFGIDIQGFSALQQSRFAVCEMSGDLLFCG